MRPGCVIILIYDQHRVAALCPQQCKVFFLDRNLSRSTWTFSSLCSQLKYVHNFDNVNPQAFIRPHAALQEKVLMKRVCTVSCQTMHWRQRAILILVSVALHNREKPPVAQICLNVGSLCKFVGMQHVSLDRNDSWSSPLYRYLNITHTWINKYHFLTSYKHYRRVRTANPNQFEQWLFIHFSRLQQTYKQNMHQVENRLTANVKTGQLAG